MEADHGISLLPIGVRVARWALSGQGQLPEIGAAVLRPDFAAQAWVTVVMIWLGIRCSRFAAPAGRHDRDPALHQSFSCAIQAATRSPIMMHGKLVLALGLVGITEASATRNREMP